MFIRGGLRMTLAVGLLVASPLVSSAQVLFSENFDDGNAASRWTTSQSGGASAANFAYDYSTSGIPAAPNGTSTTGLRFDTNTGPTGAASAIMAFPNGQNFTGNQTLAFDVWFNVIVGTAGTTEFGIFGLNHTSTTAQTPTSTSGTIPAVGPSPNGIDYAFTGDAGANRDIRAYVNGLELTGTSGGYARNNLYSQVEDVAPYLWAYNPYVSGTAPMPANQWLHVAVSTYSGTSVLQVNGQTWARTSATTGTGNMMLGYMDIFTSVAPNTTFGLYDNVSVAVAEPMATSLTWTPGGAAGGSGDWTNLGTQWVASGTAQTTWDWSLPARFGGTAGTVSIPSQITAGAGLEFLVDGYTLTSGTLILGSYDPGTGVSFNTSAIAQVSVAAGATARIESLIRGTRGLTKTGEGTLVLAFDNVYNGTTLVQSGTLNIATQMALRNSTAQVVADGTLHIDPFVGMIAPQLILDGGVVEATGATLTVDRDIGIRKFVVNAGTLAGAPGLEVTLGGTMVMSGSYFSSVDVSTLTVDETAGGGIVDLGYGRINVAAGGITSAALIADILTGRDTGTGGLWTGTTGITSSIAATVASRSIGWIDDGSGAISVAFAAPGDTNIDGQIDILDVGGYLAAGRFDTGELSNWSEGDYNYDGFVDILDISEYLGTGLFDVGSYVPTAGGAAVSAVPEPTVTSLGALTLAAAVVTMRRRLRKRVL